MAVTNKNQEKSAELSWRQIKKVKYSKDELKKLYDSVICEESKRRIKIISNLKLWEVKIDAFDFNDLKTKSKRNRNFRFKKSYLLY